MPKKRLLAMLLPFLFLVIIPFVQATAITACTFDKDTYNQGGTGYIIATIDNDEEYEIRITELTATIKPKFSREIQEPSTSHLAYRSTLLQAAQLSMLKP